MKYIIKNTPLHRPLLAAMLFAFLPHGVATADVILSTDFTDRTISGAIATVTDYTLNGVADPGTLTATRLSGGTTPINLWDTPTAQGYFAPNQNPAHWQLDIPLAVGSTAIDLTNIVVKFQSFSNAGLLKPLVGDSATAHYATVSILDATQTSLRSQQIGVTAVGTRATWTGTFTAVSGLALQADTAYTLRILISGPTTTTAAASGNHVGLDGFTLNGTSGDTSPPTPDPMTFDLPPVAGGMTSITMRASAASDPSGVEYRFTNTTLTRDSGWQDSTTWTDIGLTADTSYTYTVTARDKSSGRNAGTASAPQSAVTDAEDLFAPLPDPMTFAVLPNMVSETSITMTATTATDESGVEYLFENSTNVTQSGWQNSPVWTATGLAPETTYAFRVTARDKSPAQNTTSPSLLILAKTDSALTGSELLATRFISRTVAGATATITDYTLNGLANPGALTVVKVPGSSVDVTGFFTTPDAAGHLAVQTTTNSAHWRLDVPLTPSAAPVTLGQIVLDLQSFTSAGAAKPNATSVTTHWVTVELLDSTATSLGSQQIQSPAVNAHDWTGTFTFASGITLEASQSYTLRIQVSGLNPASPAAAGNYVGLDAIRIFPPAVGGTFAAWQEGNFPGVTDLAVIGETADPDQDGDNNLIEYALNTDPNDPSKRTSLTPVVGGSELSLTYTKVTASTDITYLVEWSSNLQTWSNVGVTQVTNPDPPTDPAFPVIKASVAKGTDPVKFLRLKIVK